MIYSRFVLVQIATYPYILLTIPNILPNLFFIDTTKERPRISKSTYTEFVHLILWKFVFAIVDQSYDISMVVLLFGTNQLVFGSLFLMSDLTPALPVMWQIFAQNKHQKWKIPLFACHPVNMILWPIIVACHAPVENMLNVIPDRH